LIFALTNNNTNVSFLYQEQAEDHGREPVSECLWVSLIMRQRVVETFSSVPRLPAWSFLRLIYVPPMGGTPHSPRQARGCGFPR